LAEVTQLVKRGAEIGIQNCLMTKPDYGSGSIFSLAIGYRREEYGFFLVGVTLSMQPTQRAL